MIGSKRLTVALLALVIFFGSISSAKALTGSVAGITVYSSDLVNYGGGTQWYSEAWSEADQPIGTIGWTTRTNRLICNGAVFKNYPLPAVAEYNDGGVMRRSYTGLEPCPNGETRKIGTVTYHEYKHLDDSEYLLDGDSLQVP